MKKGSGGGTTEAELQAAEDVERYRCHPEALALAPLGRYSDTGVRNLLLRRVLQRLPALTRALELAAAAGPPALARKAEAVVAEAHYWRAAKSLLTEQEWAGLTSGPVVLMYHAIGESGEHASRYVMPRAHFERQARWLRSRGYTFLSLRQLAEARGRRLPVPKAVVLTFDDGYRDNVNALLALGAPATVFVVTGAAGQVNCWDADGPLQGRELFGWDEARTLASHGIEAGGHSRTHPTLTCVGHDRMGAEVCGTLQDLRRELGPGSYTFAYPHGRFDGATSAAVEAANVESQDARFVAACCSRGGVNDPFVSTYAMRRVEIKGSDSFLSFRLMVWLGRRITLSQLLRGLLVG